MLCSPLTFYHFVLPLPAAGGAAEDNIVPGPTVTVLGRSAVRLNKRTVARFQFYKK
jgi:hypothetical protein